MCLVTVLCSSLYSPKMSKDLIDRGVIVPGRDETTDVPLVNLLCRRHNVPWSSRETQVRLPRNSPQKESMKELNKLLLRINHE